jgi:anaerobic selenocysteine-containing dehydrogenase
LFDLIPPKGELRQKTMANLSKYSVCPGKQKILGELGGFGAATTHAMVTGKPFQPHFYWGQTSEPIVGVEDSREVLEGFKKLDFIVNVDLFMTPTGEMADIVLPAAHPNEVDRIEYAHSGHGWPASHTTMIRQPFSPPLGEARDDMDIIFDLAKRVGVNLGWKDKYEYFDFLMKPVNMTFEDLRKQVSITSQPSYRRYETGRLRRDKRPGFETPTGKLNLYSEDLKRFGWGPLPFYIEPPISPYSTPELLKEYPYILITGGRSHAYFHTEYRQSPWMRELHPFPNVEINPETAVELRVENGDWVWIETFHGKCKQRVQLTQTVRPGTIHANHDWWFPEKPSTDDLHGAFECNPNVLVSNDGPYDPAIGTDQYCGLCKVYKATDGAPKGIWATPEQLKGFVPKAEGGKSQ